MRPCDLEGLTDHELAALTGYTSRMAAVVAHLRDAWVAADDGNALACVRALANFFAWSHSAKRNARIFRKVLVQGLDCSQAAVLVEALQAELVTLGYDFVRTTGAAS